MPEKKVLRDNEPQDIEDEHDTKYNNDASGWVRGAASGAPSCKNETAETKPSFDKHRGGR